jgi:erythronate-4-phosphate dehydrogenase
MKAIVESKIPFIAGILETLGVEVAYLGPNEINADTVRDADALFVRTRTRCDAALLDGSRVSFVATATIGTDHFDIQYLRSRSITAVNAPGCNAPAVAQYVWSVISRLRPDRSLTVGIVGVGHVGSIVAQWGRSLGYNILCCDPPRALNEGAAEFVDIDEIARRADIITLHTPLTRSGDFPTFHLVDDAFIDTLRRKPLIINSARGPVTDTDALLRALDAGTISDVAIDTWEGEPGIDLRLLQRAAIATPHIAGYSLEGKKRATTMVLDAFTAHFGLPHVAIADPAPAEIPDTVTADALGYNPIDDTLMLRRNPQDFESLRNNYPLRNEPHRDDTKLTNVN